MSAAPLALTLRAVLVATACLAPVIFVLSASLLQSEFQESRRLRAELDQSYDTRFALENLLTLHLDLETAQRGYVMTGNPVFLEPYEREEGRIGRTFDALDDVLEPASPLRASLQALREMSEAKRRFTAGSISVAQSGRQDEARDLIGTGRGKQLMDNIRVLIARMEAQESAQLRRRIADGEHSRQRLRAIFLVASAVLSLLLLIAALAGLRMNRARQRAVDQLRESAARQDAMFNSAPDGLILLNHAGRIEHFNPCAAAMFDYKPEDLQDRDVTTLLLGGPSSLQLRD